MKVLDINNLYSPTGGGIRTYHHEKLQWCTDNGIENFLIYPASGDTRSKLNGGTVIGVRSPRLANSGYNFFTRGQPIRDLIEEIRPDVIELGSGIVVPKMIREYLEEIPSFAFYHSNWPEALPLSVLRIRRGPFHGVFKRIATPRMERGYEPLRAVMGASEYSLRRLREAGISNPIKVQLGAHPETFRPDRRSEALRRELAGAEGGKIAIYIGRLAPEKGIHVLLKAFEKLFNQGNIVTVVAGGGHYTRRLERASAGSPDKLKLVGRVTSREKAAELMASADAFISAGPCDTFSLVTLEALNCGTPVVACREAASSELVEQAGGDTIYTPWYSGDALAGTITRAVNTPLEKRMKFREYAEKLTWDRCFSQIMDIYDRYS